jgi:putative glutamine amidotransferase
MKNSMLTKFVFFFLFLTVLFPAILLSRATENSLEKPEAQQEKIIVAVLHPSLDTVKDIVALKENGLIDIRHLVIVGIYHEKELFDYNKAREYVRANNLEWITFRSVSAPLSEDTLFLKNPCSAEFEKIFKESDGVIFPGGPDIPPSLYGKKTNLLTRIEDPYRHFFESSFIFHLLGGFQDLSFKPLLELRPQYPIFCICLGCETLNVGTGGTLTQDIWSEIYGKTYIQDVIALGKDNWHQNPFTLLAPQEKFDAYFLHPIKLDRKGKFCAEFGFDPQETPYIYSAHHQQADKLGKGLRVIATSLDGKVVEAIEHERYPNVLAVQFHPEMAELYNPASRVRFGPQDREPVYLRTFLEEHPPSLAFHQKLWAWVSQKFTDSHKTRVD